MENKVQIFFRYIDCIADAERKGKIRKAYQYLKLAADVELDFMQETKVWILDYMQTVFDLLYHKNADRTVCCEKLLLLRKKAKDGQYSGEIAYAFIKEQYLRLLMHILAKQYDRSEDFAEYEEIALEFTELIEKETNDTIDGEDIYSFAWCALGNYYEKTGRTALAEDCLKKVWDHYGESKILSKYAFCTLVRLVHNYAFQGNINEAEHVSLYLLDKLGCGEVKEPCQADVQRLAVEFCCILDVTERRNTAIAFMQECIKKKWIYSFAPDDNSIFFYGSYVMSKWLNKQKIPRNILRKLFRMIAKVKREGGLEEKAAWVRCNFYQISYITKRVLKKLNADADLDESVRIMKEELFFEGDRQVYFSSMIKAVWLYRQEKLEQKALECSRDIMKKLILFYSMAEYYSDNEKMEQYLSICRSGFHAAYSVLMQDTSASENLEYCINYKNIFSSVLRLRNQYEDLKHREKDQKDLDYYRLKDLERQIPENTAVVELFYINPNEWRKGEFSEEVSIEELCLEIFVLRKQNGACRLLWHRIEKSEELIKQVNRLIDLIKSGKGKYKKPAADLYQEMLKPFERELQEAEQIWISPDRELCNLPFEILLEAAGGVLSQKSVLYLQSLRDIFEIWEEDPSCTDSACVIGNPAFSLKNLKTKVNHDAEVRFITNQAEALPYSEYEAKTISGMLKGDCYIRKSASKYAVRKGYRYLHIATHGIRLQEEKNPWYESTLAFSGMVDFFHTGKEIEGYGNGILTAEEISRMKLDGTELAVLSACNSGSSIFSIFEQQTGLHVAFSAAGVKYVISALWEVDDLATAVFMFYFYEEVKRKISVPRALHIARYRLKNTTAGDMKKLSAMEDRGRFWFTDVPEDFLLYRSPSYWAGFVCYQYRNGKKSKTRGGP